MKLEKMKWLHNNYKQNWKESNVTTKQQKVEYKIMRKNHITTLPEFMLRRKMTFTFLWKPFEQKPASYSQWNNNVNEIQSWKCISLIKALKWWFCFPETITQKDWSYILI